MASPDEQAKRKRDRRGPGICTPPSKQLCPLEGAQHRPAALPSSAPRCASLPYRRGSEQAMSRQAFSLCLDSASCAFTETVSPALIETSQVCFVPGANAEGKIKGGPLLELSHENSK